MALSERLITARTTILSILLTLGVGLGILFVGSVASPSGGLDEATPVATELREQGYLVTAVEQLEGGGFFGNDGQRLVAPEGARVYRVSFRSAGGNIKAGYRVQGKVWEEQWTFPEGR